MARARDEGVRRDAAPARRRVAMFFALRRRRGPQGIGRVPRGSAARRRLLVRAQPRAHGESLLSGRARAARRSVLVRGAAEDEPRPGYRRGLDAGVLLARVPAPAPRLAARARDRVAARLLRVARLRVPERARSAPAPSPPARGRGSALPRALPAAALLRHEQPPDHGAAPPDPLP